MKKTKGYIPTLITLALLSLISLQIVWLFSVYRYKNEELKDKTRQAILETGKRLQKAEDSKFILKNMDSLVITDDVLGSEDKDEVRVIVSNIETHNAMAKASTRIEKRVEVVNDSSVATYIVKLGNGTTERKVIRTKRYNADNIKKKASDLQALFLKMALKSQDNVKNISSVVELNNVKKILKEELINRGIELEPNFSISFFPNNNKSKVMDYHIICNTPGFAKSLPATLAMPLFMEGIYDGQLIMKLGFGPTTNYIIKQMAGLLCLSFFITLLIGFVMIYIFKRMLNQERLHQLKNDFINNMTHELKTPIATISLAVDAINDSRIKSDNEKFQNYSRILKEENKKLNSHVERVLQMALLERGELELNNKRINLVSVLQSSIQAHTLQIQNQKAEVKFYYTEAEVIITADEQHFLSVFNNLLDNALKYSRENCLVEIIIEKKENEIKISFKDNGIGVEEHLKNKVFDKFFRAQGGNLHDVKGFGLGLSYVKSIINLYKGSIELKSEKGKGSEFIISLPK